MSPHACPGWCGRMVSRNRLACQTCWNRLPDRYQRPVVKAYAAVRRNPTDPVAAGAHRVALADALEWYRQRNAPRRAASAAAATPTPATIERITET